MDNAAALAAAKGRVFFATLDAQGDGTMNAAEKLAKGIIVNYNNQSQSNTIDRPAHSKSPHYTA